MAALLQPPHRRLAADRHGPRALAAFGAPLDARVAGDLRAELGTALGALDRVRFLSARLRRDLIGELRFTAAEAHASRDGIDVASLELDGADLAAMDVLRTGPAWTFLAELDRGWGLGNAARDAFATSGGASCCARRRRRQALVEAGRGLMRLWFEATRRGLAIHPWGSPFLFQHLLEDPDSLERWERARADRAPPTASTLDRDHPVLLVLRVSRCASAVGAVPAAPARRRL